MTLKHVKTKNYCLTFTFTLVIWLFFLANVAEAQHTYQPLVSLPGVTDTSDVDVTTYIEALYNFSITLAALLVVMKIIWAGVQYMFSEIVTNKQAAKRDIRTALFGLLIILSAVLILNTINPRLTNLNFLTGAENFRTVVEDYDRLRAIVNDPNDPRYQTVPHLYSCDTDNSPSCDQIYNQCSNSPGYVTAQQTNPSQIVCFIDDSPERQCTDTGGTYTIQPGQGYTCVRTSTPNTNQDWETTNTNIIDNFKNIYANTGEVLFVGEDRDFTEQQTNCETSGGTLYTRAYDFQNYNICVK